MTAEQYREQYKDLKDTILTKRQQWIMNNGSSDQRADLVKKVKEHLDKLPWNQR